MSIPKFKRKPNGLEYVDNAYVIQVETLRLVSKLNKKWTNIYIIPIEKYVCKQAELVSMVIMLIQLGMKIFYLEEYFFYYLKVV